MAAKWIGIYPDTPPPPMDSMMELALARCFAEPGVEAVLIDPLFARTRARRFYERLGFRFVERRRFGEDNCAVYRMDRDEWRSRRGHHS